MNTQSRGNSSSYRRLEVAFSTRSLAFNPRWLHMRFVVDGVALIYCHMMTWHLWGGIRTVSRQRFNKYMYAGTDTHTTIRGNFRSGVFYAVRSEAIAKAIGKLLSWVFICEMVDSWQRCKHESRRISIVGNNNLVTPSEDRYRAATIENTEGFMCAAVQWFVEWVDP
jgi:hypothetical protein